MRSSRRGIGSGLLAFLFAVPLFAGYTSTRAWIPVVGEASGAGGRGFYTTLLVANTSGTANDLELEFFAAAQPGRAPSTTRLQLGPSQAGRIVIGPDLVGRSGGGVGALRVSGSAPFVAAARVFSRGANDPASSEVGMTLNAIPAAFAIGSGESTTLLAPSATGRYKIYAVETAGFPITFAIAPFDVNGRSFPPRRLYLGAHEQRSWTLQEVFGAAPGAIASLQLSGVNGSGRIIALGTETAPLSQDFSAYEMTLPTKARHRMRAPELAAYVAVALAIVVAAFLARRRNTTTFGTADR